MTVCRDEVQIWLDDLTLAGTLHLPSGPGPHPALVTLQGSGDADRDNNGYFVPIREHLVQHGVAVLGYDKPGVGESSGDWRYQALPDRAEQALAAISFLQNHSDIDSTAVGLFGHSQGGWVAPLAASMSGQVAFIVVQSGPGIPPREQCAYDIEHSMRRDGFSEEQIQQGVEYVRSLMAAAGRDEPYDRVEANILRDARNKPWSRYFSISDADSWEFFLRSARHDPDPETVLERVTCPVLAIFGERDHLLPVAESVAVYERALARAGNRNVTIRIFPDANHRIQLDGTGKFAPGYLDTLTDWLQRHV